MQNSFHCIAFEVRGMEGSSTGVAHYQDTQLLTQMIKLVMDYTAMINIHQATNLNRMFSTSQQITFMTWVVEGIINQDQPWQSRRPRTVVLSHGTDVYKVLTDIFHDEVLSLLVQADPVVSLTLKHYKAAMPFYDPTLPTPPSVCPLCIPNSAAPKRQNQQISLIYLDKYISIIIAAATLEFTSKK